MSKGNALVFEETARIRTGLQKSLHPICEICPRCAHPVDTSGIQPLLEVGCPTCGATFKALQKFDHFVLQQMIGRGGMGAVYRALDQKLGRMVALKLLRDDLSDQQDLIASFTREAQLTALIQNPCVVRVYSVGTCFGIFYIAMELLPSGTLGDLMERKKQLEEAQVLQIGIQAAQGLQAAQLHGLIHRDIKPGNLLFSDSSHHNTKVADFGLAIFESSDANQSSGEVFGSPYYLPPERLQQMPEDFRADIYSLGATLYHALAGQPPFEAETAQLVAFKRLKDSPLGIQTFAPKVSNSTAAILREMLDREPANRQASFPELIDQLQFALSQLSRKPAVTKTRVVIENEQSRNFAAWGTLAMIVLGILLVFSTSVLWQNPSQNPAAPTPELKARPASAESKTIPVAPRLDQATSEGFDIRLSWSAAPEAFSYNVYRATSPANPDPELLRADLRSTSFTDNDVPDLTTRYYKIRAVNELGASEFSNELSVKAKPPVSLLRNGDFEANRTKRLEAPWIHVGGGWVGVDRQPTKAHSGSRHAWLSRAAVPTEWIEIQQAIKFLPRSKLRISAWVYAESPLLADLLSMGIRFPDHVTKTLSFIVKDKYLHIEGDVDTEHYSSGVFFLGAKNPNGLPLDVIIDDISITVQ